MGAGAIAGVAGAPWNGQYERIASATCERAGTADLANVWKHLHCFAQNDSLTAPGFAMRVTFYLTAAKGQRTPGDTRFEPGDRPGKELHHQVRPFSRSQVQVQRSGVRRGPGLSARSADWLLGPCRACIARDGVTDRSPEGDLNKE